MNTHSEKGEAKRNNRDWRHVDDLLERTVLSLGFASSFYMSRKDLQSIIAICYIPLKRLPNYQRLLAARDHTK